MHGPQECGRGHRSMGVARVAWVWPHLQQLSVEEEGEAGLHPVATGVVQLGQVVDVADVDLLTAHVLVEVLGGGRGRGYNDITNYIVLYAPVCFYHQLLTTSCLPPVLTANCC